MDGSPLDLAYTITVFVLLILTGLSAAWTAYCIYRQRPYLSWIVPCGFLIPTAAFLPFAIIQRGDVSRCNCSRQLEKPLR